MKTKNILSVAGFAFVGGILRYFLTIVTPGMGILLANWLGCFLLSFLTYYVIERDLLAGWLNLGLGTGLIGAFTTFSSFTTTTIQLGQQDGRFAIVYGLASLIGGLVLALTGYWLAKRIVEMEEHHD